ncbi:MAG: cytochrome c oxidase subunit 3 [Ilumatobacteraceae bacterium]
MLLFFCNAWRTHFGKTRHRPLRSTRGTPARSSAHHQPAEGSQLRPDLGRQPTSTNSFHRKYEDRGEGDRHEFVQVATAEELLAIEEEHGDADIQSLSPSFWPILLCSRCRLATDGDLLHHHDRSRCRDRPRLRHVYGWASSLPPHLHPIADLPPKTAVPTWSSLPMADTAVHTAPGHDDHHGDHHGGHYTSTGLSNNKLAMWLFLGSECLLFGGLISTYMLYRGRHTANLGPDQVWDIPFTSASSFVLLMSSLTMVLAVTAAKRHDDRTTNVWLSITAILGSLFVAGQVYEFTTFYRGSRLHDEPVLVELLHPRLPRRATSRVGVILAVVRGFGTSSGTAFRATR